MFCAIESDFLLLPSASLSHFVSLSSLLLIFSDLCRFRSLSLSLSVLFSSSMSSCLF